MKKILKNIIIVCSLFTIISCEKIIDMPIEDVKPVLVVNASINTDEEIKVSVTFSRHILDKRLISSVSDAEVKIYEDGVFIGYMTFVPNTFLFEEDESGYYPGYYYNNNDYYYLDYIPQVGKEYKIEVNHDKYDDVTSYARIPSPVVINYLDTLMYMGNYGSEYIKLSINFTDPPEEKNYYMVSISARNNYYYEDSYAGLESVWFSSNDMLINSGIDDYVYKAVFSDELINGMDYTLRLEVEKHYFRAYYQYDTSAMIVNLRSISEDLYKYYLSYDKHLEISGDPFSEPVMVYSNIEKGLGIFGASVRSNDSIIFLGNVERDIYYK